MVSRRGSHGVDGGEDAAGAGLHALETDAGDGEAPQPVLGIGRPPAEDEVGTEALHSHGPVQPSVEVVQR